MISQTKTDITFESIYKKPYAPDDTEFREANAILIPYENLREGVDYCFSEYAEEIIQYSREHGDDYPELNLDIATKDGTYKALEMHSINITVGVIIAKTVIIPAVINLVTSYIYDKIKDLNKEKVEVRVSLISVKPNGESKQINYEGPVEGIVELKKICEQKEKNNG